MWDCLCWLFTSLLYFIALVGVVCAVLYQTKYKFYVKAFLYAQCLIFGGLAGGISCIPNGKTPDNHFRMFRVFQFCCSFLNLKYLISHKENLDSKEPFIIIANHQSALDVLGMTYCWPQNCVVMLKSSLRFLPGFNLCAYLCESIYINRFSKEKAHKTIDCTMSDILEKKRKVWIYPEGTRNPGKTMLPFKKGAFIIAKEAKIPIVCCVFSSHRFFYDYETKRFDDGADVLVDILPPIDSTKFETVEELSEHCRDLMQKKHNELNAEVERKYNKKLN